MVRVGGLMGSQQPHWGVFIGQLSTESLSRVAWPMLARESREEGTKGEWFFVVLFIWQLFEPHNNTA